MLTFEPIQARAFLSGRPIVENLSQEFELLGAFGDYEPAWVQNGAGGWDHQEYGGQRQYVPLLYVRQVGSEEIHCFSLNKRFVYGLQLPEKFPADWGTPGARFRLREDDLEIFWS